MLTRERWIELAEAGPLITQMDMDLLRSFEPKRTPMNIAVQLAFHGVAHAGFAPLQSKS